MVNDILVTIVAFSGVLAGYFLSLIAPEELELGKKYFILFQNMSYALFLLVITFYFTSLIIVSSLVSVLVFSLGYFYNVSKFLYIPSGLLFFFVGQDEILLLVSILFFLTGMGAGSYEATKYVKNEKVNGKINLLRSLLFYYGWFVPLAVLPFFLSYFK